VDKGLAREDAYKVVQRNAMRSWDHNEDFRELLKSDPEALAYFSVGELEEIFDYGYYTRYINDTFQRIGLLPARVSA
jgi:adenylosuccinate lyase